MRCLLCGLPISDGDAVLNVSRMREQGIFTSGQHFGFVHLDHLAATLREKT